MQTIDWNQIILPVVNNVLIPELLAFITKFRNQNGVDPTIEQTREALALNVTEGLSMWDAWFQAHPQVK
jgi:hypothetical protein